MFQILGDSAAKAGRRAPHQTRRNKKAVRHVCTHGHLFLHRQYPGEA